MSLLTSAVLDRLLSRFAGLRMAVVGDLFLDKYLDLDSTLTEISVETGLDAYQVAQVRCYPGAAGTVLNNLHALGIGQLRAISVIGDDGEGYELLRELARIDVGTEGVVRSANRRTPTYTKPMLSQPGGPARELNRLDIKNRQPLPADLELTVIAALEEIVPQVDVVILADQATERNCGVLTDTVRERVAQLAARHPRTLFLADSRSHIRLFRNCLAKPNLGELFRSLQGSIPAAPDREAIVAAARQLAVEIGRPVYATCGDQGLLYVDADVAESIPAVAVPGPIDIVGAGDATTSGIVSALCAGATPVEAGHLGCLVASITIQQLGVTGTASPAQLRDRLREFEAAK